MSIKLETSLKVNSEILSGLLVPVLLKRCFKIKEAQEGENTEASVQRQKPERLSVPFHIQCC